MLSSKYNFIYIHCPKTGGNTIQTLFLPFSDDRKQVRGHQDGCERFEVVGPVTPEKHAALDAYRERLGSRLDALRIVASIRHPFERFVSAYLSPHRWFREEAPGRWRLVEPFWDEEQALKLMSERYPKPILNYLTIQGRIRRPDSLVRYESFADDVLRVVRELALPVDGRLGIPHLNASAATRQLSENILRSVDLRKSVEEVYKSDMDYFGYQSYKPRASSGIPVLR